MSTISAANSPTATGRSGSSPAPGRATALLAARELALVLGLFVSYRQIRYLTRDDTAGALANAHRVARLEDLLGVFTEESVQRAAMSWHPAVVFLNRYYVTVHFPATIAFLVWVWCRHRDVYPRIRRWFVAVTGAALAIHVAFPLAPPRMLGEAGFVDTLREFGPNIYPADPGASVANQFAAMPSLHFGWSVMVAVGIVMIVRRRIAVVAVLHPVVTLLAIVATANHYWIDAAVAGVLVALAAAASARPVRSPGPSIAAVGAPTTQVTPAGTTAERAAIRFDGADVSAGQVVTAWRGW